MFEFLEPRKACTNAGPTASLSFRRLPKGVPTPIRKATPQHRPIPEPLTLNLNNANTPKPLKKPKSHKPYIPLKP